ncbi:1378_t:CDS:2 [Dentiscutata heterogama]|uniref:1378_t:CDS:1 n=1 Tax=Dentiscutata heterogama TaxID=1316150 RepID=A0ACA9JW57_9GLOM|nr:1378_t:CDS:2 [Dentiscutata heterogama]
MNSYNFVKLYSFLISLCLLIISTKSQTFNYTESTSGTLFPNTQPQIVDIEAYDDGTTLVHIIRHDPTKSQGYCLEQILRIRVIQLNGTVNEINLDLKLDPVNYCLITKGGILKNPIKIYPLQKPFILISYVRTTNSSNLTTYEDWGDVIDLNGNNLSSIFFGPSYIDPAGYWNPVGTIKQNINKKLGFLRVDSVNQGNLQLTRWQQYSVDEFGKLSPMKMTNDNVSISSNEVSTMTIFSTVDSGYALVHGSCKNDSNAKLLAVRCTLTANFISYNQTFKNRQFTLYELSSQNTSFKGVYCDIVSIGVGHICTISVSYPNITNNSAVDTEFVRVHFLSSGSVLSTTVISNLPNLAGIPKYGWRVKTMPFGGYILDATSDSRSPFITNSWGVNTLLYNNNFLLASPYTNNKNTSWSFTVNSSTTTISIVFYDPVMISDDLTAGFVTIYQTSTNNIRQKISPAMNNYYQISSDRKTVNLTIISSTFNQHGENYYIEMDNNFVKSYLYKEPLTGIQDRIWNLTSIIVDNPIVGSVGLQPEEIKKFLSLPDRSKYFDALLSDIASKVPVRRERLITNGKFQYINFGQPTEQIIFSIQVNPSYSSDESSAQAVVSDLNTMINHKSSTTFSTGFTDDLDQFYGFQVYIGFWDKYRVEIIVSFIVLALLVFSYITSYDKIEVYSKYLRTDKYYVRLIHTFSGLNAIIAIIVLTCIAWPLREDLKKIEKQISGGFNAEITKIFRSKFNETFEKENLDEIAEDSKFKMRESLNENSKSFKKISNKIQEKTDNEVHEICDTLFKKISESCEIPEEAKIEEFYKDVLDGKGEKSLGDVDNLEKKFPTAEEFNDNIIIIIQKEIFISLLMDELIVMLLENFFELLHVELSKKIVDAINAKHFDKALKKISKRMFERIFSKMKKEVDFKIRRKFKSYYKTKEYSEKIQDVYEEVQPNFSELFYETNEISDLIKRFLDEIQKVENLNILIPKIFDQMKDKFYEDVKIISDNVQNEILNDNSNKAQLLSRKSTSQRLSRAPTSPRTPTYVSKNDNSDKSEEEESNKLLDICKDLLKKEDENHTMKSALIFFIIVDSESLVILENALEKYFAILDNRALEFNLSVFARHFKIIAQIRAIAEIFIKKIPLIIIMVC